jgi:hypothetical protein
MKPGYSTQEPAADVPANVRAFAGAWVGAWDTSLCSALIVEDVQVNGAVTPSMTASVGSKILNFIGPTLAHVAQS